MSDLTREYLDKKLDKLATKEDIKGLNVKIGSLDAKIGGLDVKIENEVANLAGMMSRRFDEVEKRLDVRAEVDELKIKMNKVWTALNIKN